ncbi:hypothetical protein GF1_21910 [Desulfolithobacter dissulfuricans]|uniref:Glycosyltransferase n=1 Tax=Desulfolithobacter dissulfuricans TaxID=2795293 RepID=A0A915UAQ2_9BACT|nr:hypothetical protein [Desulfolithobacter dissulfuricans]BCO09815.1 hypothetical protein GF1_21910 [Desulfolithobacter dissulfuricans]
MNSVNIVCMKWGTKYGPEYVNILHHMVQRNITLPYRFICFTDRPEGIEEGVEIFPLPDFKEPEPKYLKTCLAWRKIAVFDRDLHDIRGKILFLDLDVVIVDNIDCFFSYSDKLAIIENWSQPGRLIGQASVFCFEQGKYHHLLEKYRTAQHEVLENNVTEQFYITRELGKGNFDYFPDPWCRSFKMHCMPGGILNSFMTPTKIPEGAKIIVFHGSPNPPDAIQGVWGQQYVPWYKKFYKTVKPTRWIADYWK